MNFSYNGKQYKSLKAIKRAILVQSIGFILLIVMVAVGATVAWLSMNNKVDSNGITMGIEKTPNLVISSKNDETAGSISTLTEESWGDEYIFVDWADEANVLLPAKHEDSSLTGLIYVTNPEDISRTTGMIETDNKNPLKYKDVPVYEGGARYYLDYTVFVACLGKEMTKPEEFTDLTIGITEIGNLSAEKAAYKATSVDVYLTPVAISTTSIAVDADNFRGTLNLTRNEGSSAIQINDINSIPLNTDGALAILLRCYFDGEIGPDEAHAYVNSEAVSVATENLSFNIAIQAN